ncbi:MAG: hypothetical protein Q9160_007761 [Pyrenula sp. 1 TL-2023]
MASPSCSPPVSASQTLKPCPTCSSLTPTLCAPSCPLALLDEYSSSTESLPRLEPDYYSEDSEDDGLDEEDGEKVSEEQERGRRRIRCAEGQGHAEAQSLGGVGNDKGGKKITTERGDQGGNAVVAGGVCDVRDEADAAPLNAADDKGIGKKSAVAM